MSLQVATPLRAFLAESPQSEPPICADDIVQALISHAGLLPDETPDGDRFLLVALPAHLLRAMASHVAPAPQPMPLLEWRAAQ